MTDLFDKLKSIGALEFLVSTGLCAMFLVFSSEPDAEMFDHFAMSRTFLPYPNVYVREFSEVLIIYGAFLFLNFYVMPRLLRRESLLLNGAWILLTVVAISIIYGDFEAGIVAIGLFGAYTFIKHLAFFLWAKSKTIHLTYPFLAPGVFLTVVLWLVSFLFLFAAEADREVMAIWGVMIPSALLLYSYSFFYLVPAALKRKRPFLSYVWRMFWVLTVAELPVWLIFLVLSGEAEIALALTFVNSLFQFFVTTPFTWIFYMRHKRGTDELVSLQTELGQSTASLDFLRSQINPHFLFNALNTVYGTAIQEKAERTSEAVQKLGDMMRFMLHENLQPRIMVVREIEYLNNYISLQRLRTDALREVSIQTEIDDKPTSEQISPMLLIPFVENAFKHGISFREPSYIKIALEVAGKTLLFDVSNSNHPKQQDDPEKDRNGIGLTNVKQRLQLLYPGRHELTIRETSREFFVHLTIQLS